MLQACCRRAPWAPRRSGEDPGAAPRLTDRPAFTTELQVIFELVHGPGLQLHASISGRYYRFDRPGHRVAVDPRDVALLSRHPALRRR